MKREIIPAITLAIVFLAKYLQNIAYGFSQDYTIYKDIFLASFWILAISFSMISILSIFQLTGKYIWNSVVAIAGFILLNFSMFFYPDNLWIHFYGFSQMFLVTALFVYLYPLHSYETRKFPAFGSAFFIIYVLLEYSSLFRNQYNLTIFLGYLTITLIMFLPGLYALFKEEDINKNEKYIINKG